MTQCADRSPCTPGCFLCQVCLKTLKALGAQGCFSDEQFRSLLGTCLFDGELSPTAYKDMMNRLYDALPLPGAGMRALQLTVQILRQQLEGKASDGLHTSMLQITLATLGEKVLFQALSMKTFPKMPCKACHQ